MSNDDDLDDLRRAFAPPQVEPPPASVDALRRSVTALSAPPPLRRWPRRFVAAGAVVVTLASGSTAAFALGGARLPTPIRAILHGAGLPVESVDVARTRNLEARLTKALRDGNEPEIAMDTTLLRSSLARLSPGDRRSVQGQATRLLQQAQPSLNLSEPSGSASGGETGGPGGPQQSTTTVTTPTGHPTTTRRKDSSTTSTSTNGATSTTTGARTQPTSTTDPNASSTTP